MSVKIINFCKKSYRPHPEKIIAHILKRIPEKFLLGLAEVRLFDNRPNKTLKKNCVYETLPSQYSIIEIYMDDPLLSGIPFFSLLLLNTVFLGAVNEHIINYLRPHSEDEEILAYTRSGRINLRWGYWGIWNPLMWVFSIEAYLISRSETLYKIWLYFANRVIKKQR